MSLLYCNRTKKKENPSSSLEFSNLQHRQYCKILNIKQYARKKGIIVYIELP